MENINNNLSISTAGSLLIGAGLSRLDSLNVALILIGIGSLMKIIVAFLQKKEIPVEANIG